MTYEYVWMAKADIYELHGGGNTEAESILDASRRAGDEAFKQYKKTVTIYLFDHEFCK